jgi:hypothetical protein
MIFEDDVKMMSVYDAVCDGVPGHTVTESHLKIRFCSVASELGSCVRGEEHVAGAVQGHKEHGLRCGRLWDSSTWPAGSQLDFRQQRSSCSAQTRCVQARMEGNHRATFCRH